MVLSYMLYVFITNYYLSVYFTLYIIINILIKKSSIFCIILSICYASFLPHPSGILLLYIIPLHCALCHDIYHNCS